MLGWIVVPAHIWVGVAWAGGRANERPGAQWAKNGCLAPNTSFV